MSEHETFDSSNQIIILGIVVFFTILGPALLHTNQYEFLVVRLNINLLDASYFDTSLYASYLIIGVLIAIVSNQIGKRKIFILLGSISSGIFYFLMTLPENYGLLLILRFLQGGSTVLCWQTLMTLVLDLSTLKNRGKNMGIFGIFLALAMGGGPVLGGIAASLGIFFPYYLASCLSLLTFILSALMLKEPDQLSSRPTLVENIDILIRNPRVIIPGIFNFVDRLHIGFILFILPIFLQLELNVEPDLRGMVLGIFALPFIILQYPMGKLSDKIGRYKPLFFGSIIYGIMLSITGFLGSYGFFMVIIIFFMIGIGNGLTGPPAMALVGDLVETEDNAVGMGFFNLLGNIGIISGPLVGGFLSNYTNFVVTFIVAGIIEFISLIGVFGLIIFVFKENPFETPS